MGHSHRLHCEKGPAENVLSSSTEKFNLPQAHMTQFYSAVIESVLCSSITVWFGSASKSDIRRLQRTVRTAERIIGVHLPSLQDLYYSRVKKRAGNIITDPSHPGHDLFALLPSGRRYRSLCTRTSRHKNSFFPLCHLQPKPLTQELLPVFCNSSPISNYLLSLVLCKYVCIIFLFSCIYRANKAQICT